MAIGVSTLEQETATITGGDWESYHDQIVREHERRWRDRLTA